MTRTLTYFLLPAMFVLATGVAMATSDDGFLVTQSGKWGATCPLIVCAESGDSWSYSFKTDSTLPYDFANPFADPIRSPIKDFDFSLNGDPITALNGAFNEAFWFHASNDGGFLLSNTIGDIAFGFFYQLFTCNPEFTSFNCLPPSQLQLVPGTYALNVGFEDLFGACFGGCGLQEIGGAGPVVITAIPEPEISTPEPSTLALLATGLIGFALLKRRRAFVHTM